MSGEFVPVKREVLEQVVDAAFSAYCSQDLGKLVPALRAALGRPWVKPIAWWKLVPVEPTPEMLQAGRETPCAASEEDCAEDYRAVYKAMLEATPQPAQQACPSCGSDCNERDELIKAEREIERLNDENEALREERDRNLDSIQIGNNVIQKLKDENESLRAARQPVHQAVDWTQAGKLIDVVLDQRVRQHTTGTSNWAAAVCRLMAEAAQPVKKEESP